MKAWFKKKFAQWCREAWEEARKERRDVLASPSTAEQDTETPPKMRFAILEAINGRFIQIATYKPQQRGSDWITEYYLVPEGKKVSEALTLLMLMKGADDAPSR
jgi:hypothetical protein